MHSFHRVIDVLFPAHKTRAENISGILAGVGLAIFISFVGIVAVVLLGAIS
jgi:hypothetical protein